MEFMQEQIPERKAPNLGSISHILKIDFGLRYKSYNGAIVRYKDPEFNDKRLWVCRILS